MKIALLNVKYSPNLGDGIIAECFERELARALPGADVTSLDLAGRCNWNSGGDAHKRLRRLALLQRAPRLVRDAAQVFLLGGLVRLRLQPRWRSILDHVDCAVIGGGQLFQDGDLNFPLKLRGALAECRRADLPVAIHAVGAAPPQSRLGSAMLSALLGYGNLVRVAARDSESIRNLERRGGRGIFICRDPGLLAARIWPVAPRAPRARLCIGLGITHATVLRHHGAATTSPAEARRLFELIARQLATAGHDVICFTNGAAEDELLLAELAAHLKTTGRDTTVGEISVAPRSATPEALARSIAAFDAIVAHRLHASIVAQSYGVPSVGLAWDSKVASFYSEIGSSEYVVNFDGQGVTGIADVLARAVKAGVDAGGRERLMDETSAGIAELGQALRTAVARAEAVRSADSADMAFRATLAVDRTARGVGGGAV